VRPYTVRNKPLAAGSLPKGYAPGRAKIEVAAEIDVVKKLRRVAAYHETSVSAIVRQYILIGLARDMPNVTAASVDRE
jgi:hypothetical protein